MAQQTYSYWYWRWMKLFQERVHRFSSNGSDTDYGVSFQTGSHFECPWATGLLKGLCHGRKCLHLFLGAEAYHEEMGQYPPQMEA